MQRCSQTIEVSTSPVMKILSHALTRSVSKCFDIVSKLNLVVADSLQTNGRYVSCDRSFPTKEPQTPCARVDPLNGIFDSLNIDLRKQTWLSL